MTNANTDANIIKITEALEPILGEVRYKAYFSAYQGFFKNKILIGMYLEDKFFLRIPIRYLTELDSDARFEPLEDPTLKFNVEQFRLIPFEVLGELENHKHWFEDILNKKPPQRQLRNVVNLNYKIERLLKKVGIETVEQFYNIGVFDTFVMLVKGLDAADPNLFLRLHSAMDRRFVYSLTDEEKRGLLRLADNALHKAGLRKRFTSFYSL